MLVLGSQTPESVSRQLQLPRQPQPVKKQKTKRPASFQSREKGMDNQPKIFVVSCGTPPEWSPSNSSEDISKEEISSDAPALVDSVSPACTSSPPPALLRPSLSWPPCLYRSCYTHTRLQPPSPTIHLLRFFSLPEDSRIEFPVEESSSSASARQLPSYPAEVELKSCLRVTGKLVTGELGKLVTRVPGALVTGVLESSTGELGTLVTGVKTPTLPQR